MIQQSLTGLLETPGPENEAAEFLSSDTLLLPGFLLPHATALVRLIEELVLLAPLRHMLTPGGRAMSAALSNCGRRGWVSDRLGYRYQGTDPLTGRAWPEMPGLFLELARSAAEAASYGGFEPDVCLINRYVPGARMSLHQDRDERDLDAPIVSFSLGLPATFLWGGLKRKERPDRLILHHGDVIVWGRADRLRYHGIAPLPAGHHELTGEARYNLTFRQTGMEKCSKQGKKRGDKAPKSGEQAGVRF